MKTLTFAAVAATFILGLFNSSNANAAISPVSLAIIPPVQLPPQDFYVTGLRLSLLWGKHRQVYGVDLGLIGNVTEQQSVGMAISGGFNYNQGEAHIVGLQLAGVANVNVKKYTVVGFQLAGFVNAGTEEASVIGFQIAAFANYAPHTTISGLQFSCYNRARAVYGLQIGLINDTENLHGIQIGLLNFNRRGLFSVAPILNVGF